MILMGFDYCINSLVFIKSVQLTASFQQVRFSSIRLSSEKDLTCVQCYVCLISLLTSDFIFIKMSFIEDSVCLYSFIPSFFQVNLSVSCVGNGDQILCMPFTLLFGWLSQQERLGLSVKIYFLADWLSQSAENYFFISYFNLLYLTAFSYFQVLQFIQTSNLIKF